jgi:hypothetical protein
MADELDDECRARERARLDYVIELTEAALLSLPWDADPALRASMERGLNDNITKRGNLDREA